MANALNIDADNRGEIRAVCSDHGDIANVRTELDAVLDEVGNVALTGGGPHHFADPSKHNKFTIRIEIASIPGVQPAIDDRLVGVRVTPIITVDHRDGTHKNFAAFVNPDVNPGHRRSNRVKLDVAF